MQISILGIPSPPKEAERACRAPVFTHATNFCYGLGAAAARITFDVVAPRVSTVSAVSLATVEASLRTAPITRSALVGTRKVC